MHLSLSPSSVLYLSVCCPRWRARLVNFVRTGTYSDASGLASCKACVAGRYSDAGVGQNSSSVCKQCPATKPYSSPGTASAARCMASHGGRGHYLRTSGNGCPAGERVPDSAACHALVSAWADIVSTRTYGAGYRPPGCFLEKHWHSRTSVLDDSRFPQLAFNRGPPVYSSYHTGECSDGFNCICLCPAGKFSSRLTPAVGVESCEDCSAGAFIRVNCSCRSGQCD